jgi:hypothetical protein
MEDLSFAEKRRVMQQLESKLWEALYSDVYKKADPAKWFKMKGTHQKVYAELHQMEMIAAMHETSASKPSEKDVENIASMVTKLLGEPGDPQMEMTRPVVICVTSPFVVMMSDKEMTNFELYKSKICSVRASMDLECWQHWTSVRGAFWRHQEIHVANI